MIAVDAISFFEVFESEALTNVAIAAAQGSPPHGGRTNLKLFVHLLGPPQPPFIIHPSLALLESPNGDRPGSRPHDPSAILPAVAGSHGADINAADQYGMRGLGEALLRRLVRPRMEGAWADPLLEGQPQFTAAPSAPWPCFSGCHIPELVWLTLSWPEEIIHLLALTRTKSVRLG